MESFSDDSSDLDDLNWSYKKRKQSEQSCTKERIPVKTEDQDLPSITERHQKFEELKKKSEIIKFQVARRLKLTEKRRSKKLVKKALKDPLIREMVQKNTNSPKCEQSAEVEKKEWDEVKPFLNVNSHIRGPVSHGDIGPKNELESIIEDAIKEGDFEKAELLSDTLANKEFAGKICKAFAVKRRHEEIEKEEAIEKAFQKKKIRWTFEAKKSWEMKGNM